MARSLRLYIYRVKDVDVTKRVLVSTRGGYGGHGLTGRTLPRGIFVKLGQVLSTRADMLPPDIIAELSGLQDHVAPADPASIEARPPRELHPATLGQVISSEGSTLYTHSEDGTAIAWDLAGKRRSAGRSAQPHPTRGSAPRISR
jgi:hypothetical protein